MPTTVGVVHHSGMRQDVDANILVSDADRRAVDALLTEAVGSGHMALEEYETRVRAVWAARTRGSLAVLVEDLPERTPERDQVRRHDTGFHVLVTAGLGFLAVLAVLMGAWMLSDGLILRGVPVMASACGPLYLLYGDRRQRLQS